MDRNLAFDSNRDERNVHNASATHWPSKVAIRAVALGTLAVGALAIGALAIGHLAIGRLGAGKLAIGRARIKRLEIDDLVVGRLHVRETVQSGTAPSYEGLGLS